MTEQEALDALGVAIARQRLSGMTPVDEWDPEVAHFYRDHATAAVAFLRDNPDVTRALGIGGPVEAERAFCGIQVRHDTHRFLSGREVFQCVGHS